jgi:pepF/M3 family oligoendopeptidase
MSAYYPSLDDAAVDADLKKFSADIDQLEHTFDQHAIDGRKPDNADDALVETFERLLSQLNDAMELQTLLGTYLNSFITTDAGNELAQSKLSAMQQDSARMGQLMTRWTAWLGVLDVDALLEQSGVAADHSFYLEQTRQQAQRLMTPEAEGLASELNLSGGLAWAKLHGNVASQLSVEIELDEETQSLPMSAMRNLASNPDRDVRRRAYEAELDAWQQAEVPLAAALNGVKGQVGTLAQKRGWGSALDVALFQSNIDRDTLDAMLSAADEAFPDFRRYLKAKAKALGQDTLAWYDLFAPIGQGRVWMYGEASAFVTEQFGTFSDKMKDLAMRAFEENWIDVEARPGKRDGAFCMGPRGGESRVLMNFKPSYGAVKTLAHELGHAYHNLNLADCTRFQRFTPMTLAETASIFCETICQKAVMDQVGPEEQLSILESTIQGACQVVVDISSRFRFEQALFERRAKRELSVDELKEIMLDAQRQTYGDGLDQDKLHAYMWAVKPHYYRPELSFYNYPYMFGLLFGLGIYAQYEADPESFKTRYDDLLASTGKADAATLADQFGINIRTSDFWRSSLDVIRADIDRFESLV